MTDIDISPEAVEHLCAIHEGYEQHGTVATLRALSAALTQSRAETAAAYERAAEIAEDRNDEIWDSLTGEKAGLDGTAEQIRGLATLDQSSALAAIEAAAEVRGMRKAAEIAHDHTPEKHSGATLASHVTGRRIESAILAAIPQGDTTND